MGYYTRYTLTTEPFVAIEELLDEPEMDADLVCLPPYCY